MSWLFNSFHGLILAAVVPAIAILVKVYKEDRIEKEPLGLIIVLVTMGILSTFFAVIAERIGLLLLNMLPIQNRTLYNFLMYFGVVAMSEEGFKYLFLKRKTWNHPEFNYLFDGIVYGVSVSLGFALFENILYILEYGFFTALIRAITAVPGHACFGVFMGLWYGMAQRAALFGRVELSKKYERNAILFPVLIHGLYDFCLVQSGGITLLFILLIVIMFQYGSNTVIHVSREDTKIRIMK